MLVKYINKWVWGLLTSEKWFAIDQYHIKSEYGKGLAGNMKQTSPVTPQVDFGDSHV